MHAREARCAAAILALGLAAASPPAHAQDVLTGYAAPPPCPGRDALGAMLGAMLLEAPEGPRPAITASVAIVAAGDAFEAEIVLREDGRETRRSLRDASCAVLAESAAVVIAIALVPELGAAAPPDAAPDASERTAAPPPQGPHVGGAVRLAAHGSIGALPGVVVGGELAGALRIDALRVELAVRGVPLFGARFAVDPAIGGEIGIAVGLVRALGVLALDPRLELLGGGGVEAGAALGRGVGISDPREVAAPWVALEAALGVAWVPWPIVALVLELEALVPVVRPVFTVGGVGVLYRPEPVAGALRLAVEFRFP